MRCQSLFSRENEKIISKLRLLKYLPSMLSVQWRQRFFSAITLLFQLVLYSCISDYYLSATVKKRTFWHVRRTKTQISLRMRAVWSESSLSAWRNFHPWQSKMRPGRFWSDFANAQADLNLRWTFMSEVAQLDARPTGDQEVAGSTPPRSTTFFRGDWSWNIFYGHSLPSADSRRAVVSFWRKNVHNTG